MQELQKQQIQTLLNQFVMQNESQSKAAKLLKNVSEATVINIRKGRWELITADMWRNIGKQLGYSTKGSWTVVETSDLADLNNVFDDAKEFSNVFALTAKPGSGKTKAAELYVQQNTNAIHIQCSEFWNRKDFLSNILQKMGKDNTGKISEMMNIITETILKQESPLIILDEADKLNDSVLYFFITLYNVLEDKCGIVLLATDYLEKRIESGRRLRKKGYGEIYSRIGRKFITLSGVSKEEVRAICEANGLKKAEDIAYIYNECEGDLRRVKRAVHRAIKRNNK